MQGGLEANWLNNIWGGAIAIIGGVKPPSPAVVFLNNCQKKQIIAEISEKELKPIIYAIK